MLNPAFFAVLSSSSVPVWWFAGGSVVIVVLSFLRLFWGLIRWEIRFDLRIVEFGLHMFLLGAASIVLLFVWLFRAYLF